MCVDAHMQCRVMSDQSMQLSTRSAQLLPCIMHTARDVDSATVTDTTQVGALTRAVTVMRMQRMGGGVTRSMRVRSALH